MNAREFCYWLQGFLELAEAKAGGVDEMNHAQVVAIKRHLSMVFAHDIDPKAGNESVQKKLNDIHGGEPWLARC